MVVTIVIFRRGGQVLRQCFIVYKAKEPLSDCASSVIGLKRLPFTTSILMENCLVEDHYENVYVVN